MTYEQLKAMTLSKIDEEAGDSVIDDIVEQGINTGYMLLASSSASGLTKTSTLAHSQQISLPDDYESIVGLWSDNQMLSPNDFVVLGRYLVVTNVDYKTSDLLLIYRYYPVKLANDSDIPVLKEGLHHLLTSYGAYLGLLYKKKYDAANSHLRDFQTALKGGVQLDTKGN